MKEIEKNYNYIQKLNLCLKIFQPELKNNSLKKPGAFHLSIYVSIYLSIYLSIIYLSIYLPMYLYILPIYWIQ